MPRERDAIQAELNKADVPWPAGELRLHASCDQVTNQLCWTILVAPETGLEEISRDVLEADFVGVRWWEGGFATGILGADHYFGFRVAR